MSKLKCWKKDSRATAWYNKKKDMSVIISGTYHDEVHIYNWKKIGTKGFSSTGFRSIGPCIGKQNAIKEAQKYMKDHDSC